VTLVRPRLRGGAGTQTLPPAPPQAPAPGGEGEAGTATAPPQAPVTGPPPLETEPAPPPLAGRMARLRGRLARSQSGFGSVLLGQDVQTFLHPMNILGLCYRRIENALIHRQCVEREFSAGLQ